MTNITFIDDLSYKHIELGAGCGDFGIIFYSKCYLTDSDETLKSKCVKCHIDFFCDASELPWGANRFEKVILCNPFGYGFDNEENATKLLNELIRISKDGCEVIIICHERNKYCAPQRVLKRITNYEKTVNVSLTCKDENIDAAIEYSGYLFKCSDGSEANPNKRLKIHIEK